jgi:hypothetical protein
MLKDFSGILNRLSGMADEMSSYFRRMKHLKEDHDPIAIEHENEKSPE